MIDLPGCCKLNVWSRLIATIFDEKRFGKRDNTERDGWPSAVRGRTAVQTEDAQRLGS